MTPALFSRCVFGFVLLGWTLLVHPAAAQEAWESEIVFEDANGRLVYVSDAEGNRLPDFSNAGYRGGGVALPQVPTVETVAPVDGDDTASIQAALDAVSARPPDADGLRGAVELAPGVFEVAGTLVIRESGVVLRGAGDGDDPATSTILRRSGTSRAAVISVGRSEAAAGDAFIKRDHARSHASITDGIVPVGARSFNVDRPELYGPGDPIVIFHPATIAWLNAVDGGGTGRDPRWAVGNHPIAYVRTIERVEGTTVTVDAPVFARLDKSLSPSYIYLRNRNGVIEDVGVESLRIDIQTASPTSETHAENALIFRFVEHAWATNVTALHFWKAGISVQKSRYVTVRACQALEPHSQVTGGRRYNFDASNAQLILFEGNRASFARHAYVGNGETMDSGIVFLDNVSENAFTSSEAHRMWSTGFLFDNHVERGSAGSSTSDRRIHLGSRGDYGTSHGWACANCVSWNAQMNGSLVVVEKPQMNGSLVVVEKPPTAQNYAIGTQGHASQRGPFTNNTGAYIEGTNRPGLNPRSLYLRQLQDRLEAVSSEVIPVVETGVRLLPAFPNPTGGLSRITFELTEPARARLVVFDLLGREMMVVADSSYGAGRHHAEFDGERLPAGMYLYRLVVTAESRTYAASDRLTVVR